MRRFGFTLIELLVVIAIIAILAAILFPVFASAKLAAKKSAAVSQMRQLSMSVMMYAADYDDYFPPATNYGVGTGSPERIWPPIVLPYLKSKDILIAPDSTGKFANNWGERNNMTIGYSGATAYDPAGCTGFEPNTAGCEGFTSTVSFSNAEEPALVGLFACTPNGPMADKYRGYVFSPYNGPVHPDDVRLSAPLASDRDLVRELNYLPPSELKPIYARYGANGKDQGMTPIVFADGHVRTYKASSITNMTTGIIWRFR